MKNVFLFISLVICVAFFGAFEAKKRCKVKVQVFYGQECKSESTFCLTTRCTRDRVGKYFYPAPEDIEAELNDIYGAGNWCRYYKKNNCI